MGYNKLLQEEQAQRKAKREAQHQIDYDRVYFGRFPIVAVICFYLRLLTIAFGLLALPASMIWGGKLGYMASMIIGFVWIGTWLVLTLYGIFCGGASSTSLPPTER